MVVARKAEESGENGLVDSAEEGKEGWEAGADDTHSGFYGDPDGGGDD